MQVSNELAALMNKAIAKEVEASMQYLWQSILWAGVKGHATKDELKAFSDEERGHAEEIADRLYYLGGIPERGLHVSMAQVPIGDDLDARLAIDAKNEQATIDLYNQIIEQCIADGDKTTEYMFREILKDEEHHHDVITTLQEED